MTFAELLRSNRALRQKTQGEVAALSATTRQTISSIEKGKTQPNLVLAIKIAKALDFSLSSLTP